jgi:hypothetical protein
MSPRRERQIFSRGDSQASSKYSIAAPRLVTGFEIDELTWEAILGWRVMVKKVP